MWKHLSQLDGRLYQQDKECHTQGQALFKVLFNAMVFFKNKFKVVDNATDMTVES